MKLAVGFILCLSCIGCNTVFRSTTQDIAVRTSPPNAKLFVDGIERGITPVTVTIDKTGDPIEFRFEQEGFITEHYYLKHGYYWLSTIDWIFIVPGIFDQFFVNHYT
ncbi:MAG TPA: PEGA domain-containing protein [Planctomycetota bacterium]|nr:PEGA domain-containing protein [Planctomycetota bacterium]